MSQPMALLASRVMQHLSMAICIVHRQRAAFGSTSSALLIIAYSMTICLATSGAREYTTVGKMQHLSLDTCDQAHLRRQLPLFFTV